MALFSDWLYSVAASSVGAATLIGIAGYLGRSQISHWLSKDLEREKARHQKDLEAYKVSLIAESERVKASQDVRKAMAVHMAEKRFSAIDGLHRNLSGLSDWVLAATQVAKDADVKGRQHLGRKLGDRLSEASRVVTLSASFLESGEADALHKFIGRLNRVVAEMHDADFDITKQQFETMQQEFRRLQLECDAIVKQHISDMLAMAKGGS